MIGNDYHFSIPTDPTTSPPSEHFTNTNKATSKDSHTIIDTNIKKIIDIGEKHRKCSETKKWDQYVSLNRGNTCNDQEDCHHGFDVPAGNNYRLMNSKDPRVWQYTTLNVLQPPPSRKTNDEHNKEWNVHGSDKTVDFVGINREFSDFESKVCNTKDVDETAPYIMMVGIKILLKTHGNSVLVMMILIYQLVRKYQEIIKNTLKT